MLGNSLRMNSMITRQGVQSLHLIVGVMLWELMSIPSSKMALPSSSKRPYIPMSVIWI